MAINTITLKKNLFKTYKFKIIIEPASFKSIKKKK